MKNKLVFSIILFSLLLFVSCDLILNTLYPSFNPNSATATENFGSYSIRAELEIDQYVDVHKDPIKIALVPMYENNNRWEVDFDSIWTVDFWGNNYIEFKFDNLPPGAFRLFAFQDQNNDGKPNFNEPSTTLVQEEGFFSNDLFDYRDEPHQKEYIARGYLGAFPAIEKQWLEKFNENADQGDYQDRSFFIEGPMILLKSELKSEVYRIKFNEENITFQSIKWHVIDERNNTEVVFSNIDNNKVYTNEFWIDFTNMISIDLSDPTINLILRVEVDFGNNFIANQEIWLQLSDKDPRFDIFGPDRIDRTTDQFNILNYSIMTRGDFEVDFIEWRIVNDWWEDVFYNGSTAFNPLSFGTTNILLDLNKLDPKINSPWWDQFQRMHIEVHIRYKGINGEPGIEWWESRPIEFQTLGSGTNYSIEGEINLTTYANRYIYFYIFDSETDFDDPNIDPNPLVVEERWLDDFGYTNFSMNVFDPENKDQILIILINLNPTQDLGYYNDYSFIGSMTGNINIGSLNDSNFQVWNK